MTMRSARSAPRAARPGAAEPGWWHPLLPLVGCVLLVSTVAWFRVPLLPAIGADLAMSPTALGWSVTAFGLGRLALDLPAGRLADRVDPLVGFAVAAVALAVASTLLAVAQAPVWVLLASGLLGAASATGNTTGMTAVSASAPTARRGAAMAAYSGSLLLGQALGPTLAGAATTFGGWRTAAGCAAGLAVLVAIGAAWARWRGVGARLADARSERPAPDGPPLGTAQRYALYGVGFGVFLTVGAMPQTVLPLVGVEDLDLSVAVVGYALGLGGLARLVGSVLTGVVSDRVSRRAALLPCLVLQAAGVGLLAGGGASGPAVGWWLAAIALMSFGSSGHAVGATMLGDRTAGSGLGRELGHYRFAGDIGLVVGPVLAAAAYEAAGPRAAVGLVAAVLALGLAAAWSLPETGPRSAARAGGIR